MKKIQAVFGQTDDYIKCKEQRIWFEDDEGEYILEKLREQLCMLIIISHKPTIFDIKGFANQILDSFVLSFGDRPSFFLSLFLLITLLIILMVSFKFKSLILTIQNKISILRGYELNAFVFCFFLLINNKYMYKHGENICQRERESLFMLKQFRTHIVTEKEKALSLFLPMDDRSRKSAFAFNFIFILFTVPFHIYIYIYHYHFYKESQKKKIN